MKNFNESVNDGKEEKVAEMLRAGVNELVIHGDKRKGSESLILRPDLDSRAAIYLLELANVDYKQLTFVPKGDWVANSVNIDTGERPAFDIEEDGSVFFDHHGKERAGYDHSTSATKIIYDILINQNLLKREEWLDVLVGFVTDIDNADYPLDRDYFLNDWWRSLYGLQKSLSFESLVNFIKAGKDPRKPFTKEMAQSSTVKVSNGKQVPLQDICLEQDKLVEKSLGGIRRAVEIMKGKNIETRNDLFGHLLLNFVEVPESRSNNKKARAWNMIPLGFTAARALDFDSYFLWDEQSKGFFITSRFHLQKIYEIVSKFCPQAKIIRGTMIVCQNEDGSVESQDEFLLENLLINLKLKI